MRAWLPLLRVVGAFAAGVMTASAAQVSSAVTFSCRSADAGARPSVAELFSSEGCDSCPPAEKFFASLEAGSELVPVVWHVDYFDALGWRDRFALAASAARQRALLLGQLHHAVVTPQVFVDGTQIEDWRDRLAFRARVRRSQSLRGTEKLQLQRVDVAGNTIQFELTLAGARQQRSAWVVLTQGNLTSEVTAGENQGLLLQHRHVVRDVAGPMVLALDSAKAEGTLALPRDANDRRFRLIAWLQDSESRTLSATWTECVAPF